MRELSIPFNHQPKKKQYEVHVFDFQLLLKAPQTSLEWHRRRHRVHFLSDKSIRHSDTTLIFNFLSLFRFSGNFASTDVSSLSATDLFSAPNWLDRSRVKLFQLPAMRCRAAPAKKKSTERCTINHPRAAGAREEFRQICIQTRLEKSPWNTRIELEKNNVGLPLAAPRIPTLLF